MTARAPTTLRGLMVRGGIAAIAAVDLVGLAGLVVRLRSVAGEAVWWPVVIAGLGLGALLVMVWRRSLSAGVVGLLALSVLGGQADFLEGGPRRAFYASGVALLGWCVGLAWGRRAGDPDEQETAELGAVAALAATYFGAGMSKLAVGGLDWALEARTLRAMVLTIRAVAEPAQTTFWDRAARAVVESPGLARALAGATLVVQLGSPLWLCGRWMRLVWGLMLIGFHVSVLELTGIAYREQIALVGVLSLSSLIALVARRYSRPG